MYGSFKELLLGTGLQHRFHAMSHIGIFLEGTKASEAERGTFRSPAPILFIPHGDGKTDTYKVRTIKVQISNTVSEKCHLLTGGEPEKYLQFFLTLLQDSFARRTSRLIPMSLKQPLKINNFN